MDLTCHFFTKSTVYILGVDIISEFDLWCKHWKIRNYFFCIYNDKNLHPYLFFNLFLYHVDVVELRFPVFYTAVNGFSAFDWHQAERSRPHYSLLSHYVSRPWKLTVGHFFGPQFYVDNSPIKFKNNCSKLLGGGEIVRRTCTSRNHL